MGFWDLNLGRVPRPSFSTPIQAIKTVASIPGKISEVEHNVAKTIYDAGDSVVNSLPDVIKEPLKELLSKAESSVREAVDKALSEFPEEIRAPIASLLEQEWDFIIGKLKINDTLTWFDDIDRQLALFANECYKSIKQKRIVGFVRDEELSTEKYDVWVDDVNKIIINAIRGTKVSDIKDLISDLAIIAGKEQEDSQFKESFNKWQQSINKYPMTEWKHRLTGHSLGSAQCYWLAMTQSSFPNDRICCFAPGVGASGQYKDFINKCRNGDPRCANLHTYKFIGDPVALLACLGRVNVTKAKSWNPIANHTMENYV